MVLHRGRRARRYVDARQSLGSWRLFFGKSSVRSCSSAIDSGTDSLDSPVRDAECFALLRRAIHSYRDSAASSVANIDAVGSHGTGAHADAHTGGCINQGTKSAV